MYNMNVTDTVHNNDVPASSHDATHEVFLAQLHGKLIKEYMSVIVFVALLIVLGVVGNTLAFIFYGFKVKKNCSTMFISSLAAIDLVDCIMYVWHFLDLVMNVYLDSPFACQFYYFSNHWAVTASLLMLQVITFDRYLKICRPFSKQFNRNGAELSVFIILILSGVYSARDFILVDSVKVQMKNSNGTMTIVNYCSHSDDPSLSKGVLVSHILDICTVVIVTVTFSVLYSIILYTILQHKRPFTSEDSRRIVLGKQSSVTSVSIADKECNIWNINGGRSMVKVENGHVNGLNIAHRVNNRSETSSRRRSVPTVSNAEKNITYTMLSIAIGCVGCFIPYFIFVIQIRDTSQTLESELTWWPQLMFKSYLMNSVLNPFVYCFFNSKFRTFLCNWCFSWRRRH